MALTLLLTGCGSDSNTVMSGDGEVNLVVAEEALPEGVSRKDINITKLSDDEMPFQSGGEIKFEGYNLEPDGLTFNEPVNLEMTFENAEGRLPFFFHVSGDEVKPVNDAEYEIIDGAVSVSIPVTHFSKIVYYPEGPMFKFTAQASDTEIDDPVEASATLTMLTDTYVQEIPSFKFFDGPAEYGTYELKMVDGTQTVGGNIIVSGAAIPKRVDEKPSTKPFSKSATIKLVGEVVCDYNPGPASLLFKINVSWEGEFQVTGAKSLAQSALGNWPASVNLKTKADFECTENELPEFEEHMGDPPATNYDYDYDDLVGKSLDELKDLGKELRIYGLDPVHEFGEYYYPFPFTQFDVDTKTYYEHNLGPDGSLCGSIHFDGEKALDIDLNWSTFGNKVCGWGYEYNQVGAIIATPKQVFDWFEAYGK